MQITEQTKGNRNERMGKKMVQSIKPDYENHGKIQTKKMFTVKRNGADEISRGNCNSYTKLDTR